MFANFLYFIIALIIYTTSELFETADNISNLDNIVLFYSLIINILFVVVCHTAFNRLRKKVDKNPYGYFDHLINDYISRLSTLALIIFAINIYGLKLNLFFSGIKFFDLVPTVEAIIFLGLFLFYLIIIWDAAYGVQKQNFVGKLSKK